MNALERFMGKVVRAPPATCWLMTGAHDADGYALFSFEKVTRRAHRVSWILHFGPIPAGKFVCHKCDTPGCVNPEHLFLGTPAENIADMMRKGRRGRGRAKLTSSDVERIDALLARGKRAKQIAPLFGVTPERIWQIFPGR